MNRSFRCLTLVPALAVVALPSIASASPLEWTKTLTVFDTGQQTLTALTNVGGPSAGGRVAMNLFFDADMSSTAAWLEARGSATLALNAGPIALNSNPDIDAYVEYVHGAGEQDWYRLQVSQIDFSGNQTYIVPPMSSPNPLSYEEGPVFSAPLQPKYNWSGSIPAFGSVSVVLQPNVFMTGNIQVGVNPVQGPYLSSTVAPSATVTATAWVGSVGAGIAEITLANNGGTTLANMTVNASLAPATSPTGDVGFCANGSASWGLQGAISGYYAVTGVGGGSFPGFGPGTQSLGTAGGCWSPDGKSWNVPGSSGSNGGAFYGTGLLASVVNTGCTSSLVCVPGVSGPPELLLSCAAQTNFYDPSNTQPVNAMSYSTSTTSYSGETIWACPGAEGGVGCVPFSNYTTTWCSGGGGGSSGGGSSSGGKGGGCGTKCQ